MAAKLLECLAVDGNYSKARIGALILAIFSIAYFIWLIVLTVNMSKIVCEEEPKSDSTGWSIYSDTQPTCGDDPLGNWEVKDKAECDKKAVEEKEANFMWFAEANEKKKYCAVFKTCHKSKSKFSSWAVGETFMKDANGEYNVTVGKMDRERCTEKENNIIDSWDDVFYQECIEKATNSEDTKFMMYAEAFSLEMTNGTIKDSTSSCVLYKECKLKTFHDKKYPYEFTQPLTIYKRNE